MELRPEDWRRILLEYPSEPSRSTPNEADEDLMRGMQRAAAASFTDGINTGFYINAYITKHCPTMDGVLDEMRRGIERKQHTRKVAQEAVQERLDAHGAESVSDLPPAARKTSGGGLSSVWRWKS